MKKAKRIAYWIVVNILFAIALWAGFLWHIEGARRVAVFYAWLSFFGSFMCFAKEVREGMIERGPSVPPLVDGLFDGAVVVFLAWHGCWVLATAYLLHTIFLHGTYAARSATRSAGRA